MISRGDGISKEEEKDQKGGVVAAMTGLPRSIAVDGGMPSGTMIPTSAYLPTQPISPHIRRMMPQPAPQPYHRLIINYKKLYPPPLYGNRPMTCSNSPVLLLLCCYDLTARRRCPE